MSKLTTKQQAFVEHYLSNGFNATQAARDAGYKGSDASLRSIGYENLTKLHIAERVSQRINELTVNADQLMLLQSDIATADMGDFLSISDDGRDYELDLTHAVENKKTKLIKKIKHTRRTYQSKDGDSEITDVYELELLDPQKAQIDLLKIHGKFNHSVELTGKDGGALLVKVIEGAKDVR